MRWASSFELNVDLTRLTTPAPGTAAEFAQLPGSLTEVAGVRTILREFPGGALARAAGLAFGGAALAANGTEAANRGPFAATSPPGRSSPARPRLGTTALAVLALVGCLSNYGRSGRASSPPKAGTPASFTLVGKLQATSSSYLLALGDSLAAGYQPVYGTSSPPIDAATGYPDQGYPDGYASDLASLRHLTLIDLACPGETTISMAGKPARVPCAADYRSEFAASSQLGAALAFLSSHKHQVDLVTIDIGANDLESCVSDGAPDPSCLSTGAATVSRELPVILSKLKHALSLDDPGTLLVGMNYYDPILGLDFRPGGAKPTAEAFLSLVVLEAYNKELGTLYEQAKAPVANVASAFASASTTPLTKYGSKVLPRNVALVCLWTWMCPVAPAKYSPDIHANTTGYGVIARAFQAVLAKS